MGTTEATRYQRFRSVLRLDGDREAFWGVSSILPVLVIYSLIFGLPILFALYASVHRIPLLNPEWELVGFENYAEVLAMDDFWHSLRTGVVFTVGNTIFQIVVGIWMALVLNRITRGKRVLTAIIFTAYLIPTVIVAFWALYMFDPDTGVLHMVFGNWLGLWEADAFALGSPDWAMPLVVLIGSWKFSVFVTILALAQLRAIPDRYYEAAKICQANRWQMFRDITWPRIKGIVLVAVLLRGVFMFNKYDIIAQLTNGGPGSVTETLPLLAYEVTFTDGSYGLGSAMSVVMFLFLTISGVIYFKLFNPSEEVET
ncbi:carbohydrate ABC transporter permease [Halovivax limisalsi]|uniref:carbohydrate ABC transporter permease n=1 Tax=Halovivax limisalsi TaxID=1453760 RepID=UPI001FFC9D82|nr:sugar ABC transporter permease [Halovivax limisalsi]